MMRYRGHGGMHKQPSRSQSQLNDNTDSMSGRSTDFEVGGGASQPHTRSPNPTHHAIESMRRDADTPSHSIPTESPNSEDQPSEVSSVASSGNYLWVENGHFMPCDKNASRKIGILLKGKFDHFWPTLSHVPEDNKKQWWEEFQTYFTIPPSCSGAVKALFFQKVGIRISDKLCKARVEYFGKGIKPKWINGDLWPQYERYWLEDETFLRRSLANTANRNRITEDGRPVGKHTGGSRSFYDTKLAMERELERPVTLVEVYATTHFSKKEKAPVDEFAADVEAKLEERLPPEFAQYFRKKRARIPDEMYKEVNQIYLETVSEENKRRVKGLGNLSEEVSASMSSATSFPPSHERVVELTQQVSQLSEVNHGLQSKIELLEGKLAERDAKDVERDASIAMLLAKMAK